jgi:hypothetical protein
LPVAAASQDRKLVGDQHERANELQPNVERIFHGFSEDLEEPGFEERAGGAARQSVNRPALLTRALLRQIEADEKGPLSSSQSA